MKLFFNLFGMAAAGVLGYLAEPSLRVKLTGIEPSAIEKGKNSKVVLQLPGSAPQIDISTLTPEQLPQRVLLKGDVRVSDSASGVTMVIQAGNRVKLVRIENGNLVVSPGEGPFTGLVPIADTDLVDQLAASPPSAPTVKPAPTPVPAAVPEPQPTPLVATPITPAVGDSGDPAVVPVVPPVPEPTPVPEPAPAPDPAAAAQPATVEAAGAPNVVKSMQDSIKAAQIKEFTFDQVLEWKTDADETVDGETYQVGVASYKAETIFGVKTIQAKALIKGGKVQRWIWPKSGMEIK
jgi:hypothetical protein